MQSFLFFVFLFFVFVFFLTGNWQITHTACRAPNCVYYQWMYYKQLLNWNLPSCSDGRVFFCFVSFSFSALNKLFFFVGNQLPFSPSYFPHVFHFCIVFFFFFMQLIFFVCVAQCMFFHYEVWAAWAFLLPLVYFTFNFVQFLKKLNILMPALQHWSHEWLGMVQFELKTQCVVGHRI